MVSIFVILRDVGLFWDGDSKMGIPESHLQESQPSCPFERARTLCDFQRGLWFEILAQLIQWVNPMRNLHWTFFDFGHGLSNGFSNGLIHWVDRFVSKELQWPSFCSKELCSSKDFSLSLLTPVLDLVWDVEIPIHTAVEGQSDQVSPGDLHQIWVTSCCCFLRIQRGWG